MPRHATPHPHAEHTGANQDEEYLLSEHEAVLAATLALMTGFAHGCCPAHKGPIAAKVAEQLSALVHSMQGPQLSCDMQALLLRLRTRWTEAAAHYAQEHLDGLREQLHTQATAAVAAAAMDAPPQCGAASTTTTTTTAPTSTPDVLWHAPLETLQ